MITLENLSKSFQSNEVETMALNNVNLTINAGEFVAIMGPSGCGKSTLLNIIGMLDNVSQGSYFFNGDDIANTPEKSLAGIRKQHIGFIFQNFNLIDELSVAENIELALLYHNIPAKQRKAQVLQAMDNVGIAHRANHKPSQLSGGQQQRVAIARAVIGNKKVILADEPTGNLDSAHGQDVMEMLQQLNQEGTTIIMVTHSPEHAQYASRTINLFDGQLITEQVNAA